MNLLVKLQDPGNKSATMLLSHIVLKCISTSLSGKIKDIFPNNCE